MTDWKSIIRATRRSMQATYAEVAARYSALVSAGSDSHDAKNPPRPHPAAWCQELLTRVGITTE